MLLLSVERSWHCRQALCRLTSDEGQGRQAGHNASAGRRQTLADKLADSEAMRCSGERHEAWLSVISYEPIALRLL